MQTIDTRISIISWAFFFVALTIPFVSVLAPKGTVVIVVAAASAMLLDRNVRAAVLSRSQPFVLLAFLPFLGWSFAAVFWTIDPSRGLRVWIGVVSILFLARVLAAGAALVPERDKKKVFGSLVLAGLVFAAFIGIENLNDGLVIKILKQSEGTDGNDYSAWINPGNAILAVYAWPIVYATVRYAGQIWGLVSIGLITTVIILGPMKAATMAILFSVLVFAAVTAVRRRAIQLIALVMSMALLTIPYVVRSPDIMEKITGFLEILHINFKHRVAIWSFVSERIVDHPIIGWGLDSSRLIPGSHEKVLGKYAEVLPLHPHNGFLQVWLELGAVGAAMFLVVMLSAFHAMVKTERDGFSTAVLVAAYSAFLILGQLSFGIWQNWWIATGCVALCLSLIPGPHGNAE